MPVYIRLVDEKQEGTAPISGKIEKVHSPDNATLFSYGDADFFRKEAYKQWPKCDWQAVKVAGGKCHVSSVTDLE